MLDNIRCVLVNTSHPGNIGAAARAMKTMRLSSLYLVSPKKYPDAEATAMAAGADDILQQAIVVPQLEDAIADCELIIGTSARLRNLSCPMLDPRQCGELLIKQSKQRQVALVFGREQTGLTNEELHRCHYHVNIPSNPDYSSLNLAAAVQVLAHEINMANTQDITTSETEDATLLATAKEMELFYEHLEETLITIDFLKPSQPKHLMLRLRRLFNRAQPEALELNILRGILSRIQKRRSV